MVFNLKIFLTIYLELITNFEFNFDLAFNKNIPSTFFILMLSHDFLYLTPPHGMDTCHFYVSHGNSKA